MPPWTRGAGEETPSEAGRGGVASTGSIDTAPPETGAETAGGEVSLLEGEEVSSGGEGRASLGRLGETPTGFEEETPSLANASAALAAWYKAALARLLAFAAGPRWQG